MSGRKSVMSLTEMKQKCNNKIWNGFDGCVRDVFMGQKEKPGSHEKEIVRLRENCILRNCSPKHCTLMNCILKDNP